MKAKVGDNIIECMLMKAKVGDNIIECMLMNANLMESGDNIAETITILWYNGVSLSYLLS